MQNRLLKYIVVQ